MEETTVRLRGTVFTDVALPVDPRSSSLKIKVSLPDFDVITSPSRIAASACGSLPSFSSFLLKYTSHGAFLHCRYTVPYSTLSLI